ncbi:MAG: choice-of-anchor D domain-containing protein [Deltaproteobacteria bacterium]
MRTILRLLASSIVGLAAGCNCHQRFEGLNGSLSAAPPSVSFGNQAQGSTVTDTVVVTNIGTAPVSVTGVTLEGDTHQAFKAVLTPTSLGVGSTMKLQVSYTPPAQEADSATALVQNDTGTPLSVPLTGQGKDPCYQIACNGTNGSCTGTCQAGKCVYAGPCSDKSQCLSAGTCNPSTGACEGQSDCLKPGAGTCNGNVLSGDVPPGTCNQGTGQCLYTHQTVTCDCACAESAGGASCVYNWVPVSGAPTGEVSSVWSAGQAAGDLWLDVINRTSSQAAFNPQTVYHEVSGSWSQAAQVGEAQNPFCQGPGCGMLLTGSSDGDIYGAVDCTQVSGSGANATCAAGGAWHFTGSGADEGFPTINATTVDLPLTPILDLGGTGFALNTDSTGPELVSGSGGKWTTVHNFRWYCQALGAIWGTSASDLWVSWGCTSTGTGVTNPGVIAYWNGQTQDVSSQKALSLAASEYADAMWGTGDSDVWAVGTHRWHYDGAAWTQDPSNPPGPDSALWGNGTDYFAGGGYPDLYHYSQGGSWQLECIQPGYGGPSVTALTSDGTSVYAATATGLMVRQ